MRDLDILESWKEIADYLKKSERTCRRWEQEFDLPIHRMDGSPKARVFAYKHELDKWIQEMLQTVDDSEKRRITFKSLNKPLAFTILFFALCLIGVIFWRIFLKTEEISSVPNNKPSLAILYFENNSGEETLDNWRSALTELLITDLSQSRFIHVLSSDRIYTLLEKLNLIEKQKYSTDDLKEVASKGRITHVLTGSYITAGDQFIINIALQNPYREEDIKKFKVEGIGESSILESINKITPQVKSALNISDDQIAADIDEDITVFSTKNPEARRLYLEGRTLYRRGEYRKSIEVMKKVVEIDPEFAMAYRNLWAWYLGMNYRREAGIARRKALELADRLPIRERLIMQAWQESSARKRLKIYKQVLDYYPEDEFAIVKVGELLGSQGEWDQAIDHFEAQIKKGSKEGYENYFFNHLALAYCGKGLYDAVLDLCDEYPIKEPDESMEPHRAQTLLCQGKYERAQIVAERILATSSRDFYLRVAILTMGNSSLLTGDFIRAEEWYQKLLDNEEASIRFEGIFKLFYLYLAQGKFEKAKVYMRKGIELGKKENQLSWQRESAKGLSHAENVSHNPDAAWREYQRAVEINRGRRIDRVLEVEILLSNEKADEAQAVADELKKITEKGLNTRLNNLSIIYPEYVQSIIDLEKGDSSSAIEHLQMAMSFIPAQMWPMGLWNTASLNRGSFTWALAEAYRRLGDLEKAQEQYEEITRLTSGRLKWGDLYAKSYYMLGKIAEQKDWPGKAIDYYEKFLDLWKDADPGMAEVEDAKEKLKRLKSH